MVSSCVLAVLSVDTVWTINPASSYETPTNPIQGIYGLHKLLDEIVVVLNYHPFNQNEKTIDGN